MAKKFIFIFIALLLFLVSCEPDDFNGEVKTDKELIHRLKSEVADTLIIGSDSLVLDVYLWRDFQPISPAGGKSLISVNRLISINSNIIPDNIQMIKQYVIYENSIWITDYESETESCQSGYKIERVSRNGPKWGPKVYVDVISQIQDLETHEIYYIGIENVYIERTD